MMELDFLEENLEEDIMITQKNYRNNKNRDLEKNFMESPYAH